MAVALIGWLAYELRLDDVARVLGTLGVAVVVACGLWWWFRQVARPHSAQALIARRADLDARHGGVATRLDLAEHTSKTALRLQATTLRPSLRSCSWWERRHLDPRQLGVEVARLGYGWWGEQVWSSCEDATLRIAGPRTGKTVSLAAHGMDAPGALITTSTRLDLAELVHSSRAGRGPVHVFNPSGLGGLRTTVRWRVLAGCEDFATAERRAADLIPATASTEGERWDVQARRILALFLHAAAISGLSMRDVLRWVADPSTTARDEILDALRNPVTPPVPTMPAQRGSTSTDQASPPAFLAVPGSDLGSREREAAIRAFFAINDRTLTSITTTMAVPLAWMSQDGARWIGDPPADDPDLLDLTRLLEAGETLHLIGSEDSGSLAPLIAALVADIAHTARRLAATKPGGRLDPPVTMLLDEVALVCPVPLDKWTADMGGRGVTLHLSVQSLAQLRNRWGDNAAEAILANVATFLVFGGSPAAGDLSDLSTLAGDTDRTTLTDVTTGRAWHRRTPWQAGDGTRPTRPEVSTRSVSVLSAAQIRALEPGQVFVLRRGIPPLVAWAPRIIDRRRWTPSTVVDLTTTPTAIPDVPDTATVDAEAVTGHGSVAGHTGRVPTAAELEDLLTQEATEPRHPQHDPDADTR